MVGILVKGCSCVASQCDVELTFDLAIVKLTLKVLSYYIKNESFIKDDVFEHMKCVYYHLISWCFYV